jgi:hypothetical protein
MLALVAAAMAADVVLEASASRRSSMHSPRRKLELESFVVLHVHRTLAALLPAVVVFHVYGLVVGRSVESFRAGPMHGC